MIWSCLDRRGQRVNVSASGLVEFVGLCDPIQAEKPVYAPVVASDGETALLVYREPTGARDEPVRILCSNGWQAKLPGSCEGKWPLAVKSLGMDSYHVAFIMAGCRRVFDCTVDVEDRTISEIEETPRMPALTFMEIESPYGFRFANGDGTEDVKAFTRPTAGGLLTPRTIPLIYWREVGYFVVGCDARPHAPNQVLLGCDQGWFIVAADDKCVLFPPFLSEQGNVSVFEGRYYELADILTRPLPLGDPVKPAEPVEPVPVVPGPLDPPPSTGPTAPPGPPANVTLPPASPLPQAPPAPQPVPKWVRIIRGLLTIFGRKTENTPPKEPTP